MFKEVFGWNRFFIAFIAASVLAAGGCKSTFAPGTEETSAPQVETQQKPVAPILADGTRGTYADIVDRVAPAVVKVSTEGRGEAEPESENPLLDDPRFRDFFKNMPQNRQTPRTERGLGSGVIVSSDGTILTNNHVIEGADKIRIEMNDNRTFEAKVVGTDPLSDLAVIKIENGNLPYLTLGNSDQVRVGDIVLAIGNPLGIGQTVTAGIISAKGRRTGLSDGSFEDFLQTDAPINRGNSGGALINLNGELIGINSQILSPSGGNIGIGFSIPSNMAKTVMDQLVANGKVRRGQLGVVIQNITPELGRQFKLEDTRGVIVSDVSRGSAAEKAGVRRGDVITAVNGERVEDSNVLRNKVAGTAPGSEVKLTVLRDGSEQTFTATLDELSSANTRGSNRNQPGNPGNSEGGKLGLNLQPLTPDFSKRLGLPEDSKGMLVAEVDPNGSAAQAGIQKGDAILEINRQPVASFEEVQRALSATGSPLLLVARGGQTLFVTVEVPE